MCFFFLSIYLFQDQNNKNEGGGGLLGMPVSFMSRQLMKSLLIVNMLSLVPETKNAFRDTGRERIGPFKKNPDMIKLKSAIRHTGNDITQLKLG